MQCRLAVVVHLPDIDVSVAEKSLDTVNGVYHRGVMEGREAQRVGIVDDSVLAGPEGHVLQFQGTHQY